jgi:hypothetical protein
MEYVVDALYSIEAGFLIERPNVALLHFTGLEVCWDLSINNSSKAGSCHLIKFQLFVVGIRGVFSEIA